MDGLALIDAGKARLGPLIPSRTVYAGAVPDGPLPAKYIVLWASEGSEESTRSTGTMNVQTPELWVSSVSRNERPEVAAREAAWGAREARKALRGWRPESDWALRHEVSAPARRDELATAVVYVATEQFSLRSYV